MSEIIRYDVYGPDNLGISADGDLVRFEDYDALREQNRVLREVLKQALDDIPGWVMLASGALTATSQEGQG